MFGWGKIITQYSIFITKFSKFVDSTTIKLVWFCSHNSIFITQNSKTWVWVMKIENKFLLFLIMSYDLWVMWHYCKFWQTCWTQLNVKSTSKKQVPTLSFFFSFFSFFLSSVCTLLYSLLCFLLSSFLFSLSFSFGQISLLSTFSLSFLRFFFLS